MEAQDDNNNVDVNYTGSKTVTWTWNNANNAPLGTVAVRPVAAVTFTNGVFTPSASQFKLFFAGTGQTTTLRAVEGTKDTTSGAIATVVNGPRFRYKLTASTAQTAGTAFGGTVTAYDAWDNVDTVTANGATNLTFAFATTTNTSSRNGSGNGLSALVPGSAPYTFTSGVASTGNIFTLYNTFNAGTTLNITADATALNAYGTAVGSFVISPAATADYIVVHNTAAANTPWSPEFTTTTITADQTLTLYAHSYDMYGNPKGLLASAWAGTGVALSNVSPTAASTSTVFTPVTNGTGGVTATAASTTPTDSTGVITVDPGALSYFVVSAPGTATAGADLPITVTAKDADGNTKLNFTGSQAITWSYNGTATASSAPSPVSPVIGPGSVTFTAGVYTSTANQFVLYNAADTNVTVRATQGTPTGISGNIATVSAGPLFRYRLSGVTTTQVAGTAFGGTVSAFDQWNNPKNVASNPNLTFTWTGTTATSSRNGSGNALNALPATAQTINFAGGSTASTGNIFELRKNSVSDTNARLNITGSSDSVTAFTEAQIGPFTINPAATADYIVVHNTAAANTPWSAEFTTTTITADQTLTLYAHSYDMYGNPKGLLASAWAGSGVALSNVSPTAASTSTVFTPVTNGTGDVTATAAATTPTDATGVITVDPGALASFVVSAPGSATAGADLPITVTAKDADGNTKLNFTGSQAITWTYGGTATNAPLGTAPVIGPGSVTFTAGVYTSTANQFVLYNAANTNVTLRATQGTPTGISGNIATVAAGTPTALTVPTISATTVTAGDLITATLNLKDAWGNFTSGNTACTVAASGWASSPGHSGAPATAPVYPGAISASGTGVYTISSNLRLYNAASTNLVFTASGGQCSTPVTVNQAMTVNPVTATVDHIWLNDVNSIPGSHLATKSYASSATPSGSLFAFAWDAYGNNINSTTYVCPTWSYSDGNGRGMSGFTLPGSTHQGSLSSTTWHIEGNMKCTAGAVDSSVTAVFAQISKTATYGCGGWACNAGAVERTCNVNNATGYDIASVSYGFSGTGSSSGCTGGLLTGNNCNATVTGTVGQAIGTATATITASNTTNSIFPSRTFTDATVAPSCTQSLTPSTQSAWSCDDTLKKGVFVARATNTNGAVSATFAATTFSVDPGNMVVTSDVCDSAGAALGWI